MVSRLSTTEPDVFDNPGASSYEIEVDGQVVGFAQYEIQGRRYVIPHVVVDENLSGRGLGNRLVRGALDDIRAKGF